MIYKIMQSVDYQQRTSVQMTTGGNMLQAVECIVASNFGSL